MGDRYKFKKKDIAIFYDVLEERNIKCMIVSRFNDTDGNWYEVKGINKEDELPLVIHEDDLTKDC